MKDKRIKVCPNLNCECGINIRKNKYTATDMYCKKCGSELVFVCSKCLNAKIDDLGPDHKICAQCDAEIKDKNDVAKGYVKKVAGAAAGVGIVIAKAAKNEMVKEAAKEAGKIGKEVVKVGADMVKKQIKL